MTVLTAISRLKRKCISYLKPGEIEAHGDHLVFFLDNREIERVYLPELTAITENIYFNRYGISAGGEMILQFSRRYRIIIEEVSGKIRLE